VPNPFFYDHAVRAVAHAVAAARDAARVDHLGTRGRWRENAINQLFRPFLEATPFRLGTGTIVDWRGAQSAQTDIVIYAPGVR